MYTNENYLLPSHDEVVHGKKSMMHKMYVNQFAGLVQPLLHLSNLSSGKKPLFMGSEYGQFEGSLKSS